MGNYFEDAIQTGQPIVPPNTPTAPVTPVETPAQDVDNTPVKNSDDFKGLPVRTIGDRIFLLKGGKKAWITNAEAYQKLGFNFGDEVKIDQVTLDIIPEGDAIR